MAQASDRDDSLERPLADEDLASFKPVDAGGMLRASVNALQEKYETVLEAIQHQELVLSRLNALLQERLSHREASRDAALQTDFVADEHASAFMTATALRVRIFRVTTRRRVFEETSRVETEQLHVALEALRLEAADYVPAENAVESILAHRQT